MKRMERNVYDVTDLRGLGPVGRNTISRFRPVVLPFGKSPTIAGPAGARTGLLPPRAYCCIGWKVDEGRFGIGVQPSFSPFAPVLQTHITPSGA